MSRVCVDTNFLIWAIRGQANPTQTAMIGRAQVYLQYLEQNKDRIIIPTIVLAEFLNGVPNVPDRTRFLRMLNTRCMVADFDLKAAHMFATLWDTQGAHIQQLRNNGNTRPSLKADCMIAATAITAPADLLITNDKGLRNFIGNRIPVQDIPIVPVQTKMTP